MKVAVALVLHLKLQGIYTSIENKKLTKMISVKLLLLLSSTCLYINHRLVLWEVLKAHFSF